MSKHRNKKRNYQKKFRPLSKIDKAIYVTYMLLSYLLIWFINDCILVSYKLNLLGGNIVAIKTLGRGLVGVSLIIIPLITVAFAGLGMVMRKPLFKISKYDDKKHIEYVNTPPLFSKKNKRIKQDVLMICFVTLFTFALSLSLGVLGTNRRYELDNALTLKEYNIFGKCISELDSSSIIKISPKANRVYSKGGYLRWFSFEIEYSNQNTVSIPFGGFNDIGEVNGFYERLSDKFEGTVGIEYVSEIEEKEKYTQEECRIINYIFGLIE